MDGMLLRNTSRHKINIMPKTLYTGLVLKSGVRGNCSYIYTFIDNFLCGVYTPLKIAVNSSTSIPKDRLVFTNIKIVLGFGVKGANFVERTKLTQVTMRIIINVTRCLLSKTIP